MEPTGRLLLAVAAGALCASAWAADDADLDALFDLDGGAKGAAAGSGIRWGGYTEFAAAYTTPDPGHWSKLRGRLELSANGRLGEHTKWKLSARADVDPAYEIERNFYPEAVRDDQRADFMLRENYLDVDAGDWVFRLGRQHVVWGEMVGLFFADVVSARDMREFFLPEFEVLRIPQWAGRAEYFAGDTHFELLWIPVPSFDDVGKPGADFYPFPLPAGTPVRERKPERGLGNTNWGLRVSQLVGGWDLAAFYYRSLDVSPTLYRVGVAPMPRYELRHDRIDQIGATMSKDMGSFVLKGEAVHTHGRSFVTNDPTAAFGLKASDTLDYVVGVDVPVRDVWRVNAQVFSRAFFDHDPGFAFDRNESGWSLLLNRRLGDDLEAEVLLVSSFNRSDYMLRPKVMWRISPEWRGQVGLDLFGGRKDGIFGRFDDSDRVYMELRRWF